MSLRVAMSFLGPVYKERRRFFIVLVSCQTAS